MREQFLVSIKPYQRLRISALIPHSIHPSTACTEMNVNTIATIVRDDHHLSYRAFARQINMLKLSIYTILTLILKIKCFSSIWVLHMLAHEQVNQHCTTCEP